MARAAKVFDPFTAMILVAVLVASVLPCRGALASAFHVLTVAAVVVLFFLHGAKLSREAVLAGMGHWRLHLLVVTATFVVFPLCGLVLRPVLLRLVGPELYEGMIFLCALPATVQSAIVFTSIAGGNVPAAICSASLSTLLGVVLTPLILGITGSHHESGGIALSGVRDVALEILLPFVAGQVARRFLARWLAARASVVAFVDRGTIVLVVYVAFSDAVVQHLWERVSGRELAGLVVASAILLGAVLTFTAQASRWLGFSREDQIAIVFGGSKKSLTSGVAMANVLFAPSLVGVMVLPLMLFHQMQLMACALLARRYAREHMKDQGNDDPGSSGPTS
jgi:sodium/bile acid cotransporter 7